MTNLCNMLLQAIYAGMESPKWIRTGTSILCLPWSPWQMASSTAVILKLKTQECLQPKWKSCFASLSHWNLYAQSSYSTALTDLPLVPKFCIKFQQNWSHQRCRPWLSQEVGNSCNPPARSIFRMNSFPCLFCGQSRDGVKKYSRNWAGKWEPQKAKVEGKEVRLDGLWWECLAWVGVAEPQRFFDCRLLRKEKKISIDAIFWQP